MAPFLIGLLVLGGGASIAAHDALPGSALYGVKVGFNENVRGSLSFSDEAKAHWDSVLQGRRLDEAERLAAKGKLDAKAEAQIKKHFDAAADDYQKHVDAMKAKKGNESTTLQAESDAEAMLAAHTQILSAVVSSKSRSGSASASLMADAQAHLDAVRTSRSALEVSLSGSGSEGSKAVADESKTRAKSEMDTFASASAKFGGDADIKTMIDARVSSAKQAYDAGSSAYDSGSFGDAFLRFEDASRISQESSIFLNSNGKVGSGINLNASGNANAGTNASGNTNTNSDGSAGSSSSNSNGNSGSGSGSDALNANGGLKVKVGL